MKINKPTFVTSAFDYQNCPDHNLLEFAFVGRSNVGKSSMINKIVNRKKLAKTSSQPGRTQCINFYNIDDKFFFVDLPGYGFASVSLKVKEKWGILINDYLSKRGQLAGIILVVDSRHDPSKDDILMANWLRKSGCPTLVVGTKADKISRAQKKRQERIISEKLNLTADMNFVFFSIKTGEGLDKLSAFFQKLMILHNSL